MIIDWENGPRQDKVLQSLLNKVTHLPIRMYYTDNWGAYHRLLPCDYHHLTGKDNTSRNFGMNFRTHIKRLNRKTICFSKNEKIHLDTSGCNRDSEVSELKNIIIKQVVLLELLKTNQPI